MRAATNFLLDVLRRGSPLYLPRDGVPPWLAVHDIFRKFQRNGAWEAIGAEMHVTKRERLHREASPSVAIPGSQSVKSAEKSVSETTR